MKARTYTRSYVPIWIFILVIFTSFLLFSYSHKVSAGTQPNSDCGSKCTQQRAQTEFVLWESLVRNLLSSNR